MTVRVRMFRQGLGDCFLLTFETADGDRHVLIDCGSLGATTTGVKMDDVVADIRELIGAAHPPDVRALRPELVASSIE